MLAADVTDADAEALSIRALAEPLTALLTVPFVLLGPIAWELAWLSYPMIAYLLRVRSRRQRAAAKTTPRSDG